MGACKLQNGRKGERKKLPMWLAVQLTAQGHPHGWLRDEGGDQAQLVMRDSGLVWRPREVEGRGYVGNDRGCLPVHVIWFAESRFSA